MPYRGKKQLSSIQARPDGFLKETEQDKTRLHAWIRFINNDCDGPLFKEEDFQFDWTVDEDPLIYGY
jgi:hypothetical protein